MDAAVLADDMLKRAGLAGLVASAMGAGTCVRELSLAAEPWSDAVPDLIVVLLAADDARPDGLEGIGALAPTLVVLDGEDCGLVARARALAPTGFLIASRLTADRVRAAIEAVAAGGTYVPPEILRALLEPHEPPAIDPLTPRERQAFDLLVRGLSNAEIARSMGISVHGVKRHVSRLLRKLAVSTRAEAVAVGLRMAG